jgi:dTDP-4-dehydrorhamnose reductase
VRVANDTTISPTYVPDLVNGCLDLLIDDESGIWHIANAGAVSRGEFAMRAAKLAHVHDAGLLKLCSSADLGLAAKRPRFSALASERTPLLPSLDDALERYIAHRRDVHLRQ